MINLRTLDALREYTAAVGSDHGIPTGEKASMLRSCRFQAARLVECVSAEDQGKAYAMLVEIESR